MGGQDVGNKNLARLANAVLIASTAVAGLAFAAEDRAQSSTQPANSAAAPDEVATLAEIIVTASKREEKMQDVPIAITALSGSQLASQGVQDTVALTKLVPGLNAIITSGYGGKVNYTLRGVGLNTFSEVQEAAVAVYQDEVYIASPIGAEFSLFDTQRVEVLRGPQGTLFGRSASGGLVHFISQSPGTEFGGYLTGELGSYGEHIFEGAVDIPLDAGGSNALRLSARYNASDGFLKNLQGGSNLEGGALSAARVQLRLEPAPGLSVLFKAEYGQSDSDHGTGYKHLSAYADAQGAVRLIGPNDNIFGVPGADLNGYRDTSTDFYSVDINQPGQNHIKRTFLDNKIEADLGFATLTSVSGYVDIRKRYLEDGDGSPIDFSRWSVIDNASEFQQEVRLSSRPEAQLRWTIGGFYFNYRVNYDTTLDLPIGFPAFGIDTPLSVRSPALQSKHSIASYAQGEVPLGSKWSVTAGGRIERESNDFSYNQVFDPQPLGEAILGGAPEAFSSATVGDLARIRTTYLSGGVTVNYRPIDNVLFYTSMKRGIKPGGFSTPIAPLENDQMRYKDEKLDALEGGVKSDLLDKRLRLNISAYHYWYKDYQAVQFAGTGTYTTNADARVSGVDAEIVWAPLWSTEFGVNGGYLDGVAKNISLSTPSGVLTRDRQLPNAPKVSLNAYGRYRFNLAGGELSLRVDSILRSKTYFEIQNSPALSQGEYAVVDLSAGWQRGDWSLSATASNVLDRHYYAFLQDGSDFGLLQGTQGRPRWLSVQVTKRW